MIKRFRMVAGPNGSGKTTLVGWLTREYAVNFYTMLNADDVFARVGESQTMFSPFPIDGASLMAYVEASQYDEAEKERFRSGEIAVDEDCVRFASKDAINAERVVQRYAQGGHDVPPEKITARYGRSLANIVAAIPYLSRAFFFDNSHAEMRYLASYENGKGMSLHVGESDLPWWFKKHAGVGF